jgi:SEC-C motif-containing protein
MAARDCPCGSAVPYRECCGPLHRGGREAADARALMASRYAAFATKQVDYLWRTLDAEHEDRARPRAEFLAGVRRSCETNRYMGLRILDDAPADAAGVARVLFLARVFERGKDRSFVERSEFRHDGVGWRYWRGEGAMVAQIANVDGLTLDTFP